MSRRAKEYKIIDEPRPGTMSKFAVDPLWPFLALMMAGPWLGFPWFVFNGMAIGSARLKREITWVVFGWLGVVALFGGLYLLVVQLNLGKVEVGYLKFAPVVWLMITGYVLHFSQARSAQLFAYFGGTLRNGMLIALAGAFFVREPLGEALQALPLGWFLRLVIA